MNAENLDNILPSQWAYEVINRCDSGVNDNKKEEITIKIALFSGEDIKLWIKALEDITCCNYSIRSTHKPVAQRVIFKQRLHCRHNTRNAQTYSRSVNSRTRNTNCPSVLIITLQVIRENFRGDPKNAPDPLMPCIIKYVSTHNHDTLTADTSRFRRVLESTKETLKKLYQSGHSPSTALESLKVEIQLKHENYEALLVDRRTCPGYNYCYMLYKQEIKKLEPIDFKDKTFLINKLKEYNEEIGEECAMFDIREENYVITLCPPLFKRIHENIESASEIVFMDTIADHEGSKIYILSTHSECSGLPLGIIITSSETAENIAFGFEMLKNMLGNIIFHNKIEGPLVFITDDSEAKQIAIESVWKHTTCLLCTFHVQHAVYKWLVSSKNGIPSTCIKQFFEQFRLIMYATTIDECEQNYNEAVNAAELYSNYIQYLEMHWNKRDMWALNYRSSPLFRGNNADISEAAMRLLKDKILNRAKSFNIVQLFNFFTTRFVEYYQKRLLDAADNCLIKDKMLESIRLPTMDIIQKIQLMDENTYIVPSESGEDLWYIVYADILLCTCIHGSSGTICKHIDWVHMLYYSDAYRRRINNIQTRTTFLKIATGEIPCQEWLDEVEATTNNSDTVDFVIEEDYSNLPDVAKSFTQAEQHKTALIEGHKLIKDLSEGFTKFLNAAPIVVVPALQAIVDITKQIKTVDAFVSSCTTFSSEIYRKNNRPRVAAEPTIVRRKTFSKKINQIKGRPKKNKLKHKVPCASSNMQKNSVSPTKETTENHSQ